MSFRVRHLCISTFENYNILFPLTDRFITIVWTSKKLWKIFAYHNSVSTLSLLFPYQNRIHFITVVNFCDLLYQLFRRVNCMATMFLLAYLRQSPFECTWLSATRVAAYTVCSVKIMNIYRKCCARSHPLFTITLCSFILLGAWTFNL